MKIWASVSPGEVRAAAVEGGRLVDFALSRPGADDVGDLHRGRVTARVPALAGCFVALAGAEGFLPDSAGGAGASEGQVLALRITRAAQGGKGPRLTAATEGVAAGPVGLVRRGPDAVERLAALHPEAPIAIDDAAHLATLRPHLGARLALVRRAFDDALEDQLAALAAPEAELPGGARLSVHPTPALTAIDIDLAGGAAARRGKTGAHLAGNRAIIPELARQIRLRNLAGAIVVDFAGLSAKRRQALGPELAQALAADPVAARFLGFSALGLAEILRPRGHAPLHELLAGPHAAGLRALREAADAIAATPAVLPHLRAAADVTAALQADPTALAAIAARAGRSLPIHLDPALPLGAWRLETPPHG